MQATPEGVLILSGQVWDYSRPSSVAFQKTVKGRPDLIPAPVSLQGSPGIQRCQETSRTQAGDLSSCPSTPLPITVLWTTPGTKTECPALLIKG